MQTNYTLRPRLAALKARKPFQDSTWKGLLVLDEGSATLFRAISCSFPHALGVMALAVVLFLAPLVFMALPSPWSWVSGGLLLVLSLTLARGFLHGRIIGPVLEEQAEKMHGWFAQSPALTEAASHWASADSVWRQADYHRVRLAYREECRARGAATPRWQVDLFGFSHLPRALRFFERYLPLQWCEPSRIDMQGDREVGEDWLAQARVFAPVDPGGYTPKERGLLNQCVARYSRRQQLFGEVKAGLSARLEALAGLSHASGLREGGPWRTALLPVFLLHTLAGYVVLFFATLIMVPVFLGLQWFVADALGSTSSLVWAVSWAKGLLSSHPGTVLAVLCASPLLGASLLLALRYVRLRVPIPKGSVCPLPAAWEHLPLSSFARQRLGSLLQENPRVASWFFAHVGQELRQVEYRFARELWHAMARVDVRDVAHTGAEKALEAIRGLPATAAYEARLLAEQMQGELPEAPEGPDLPRRSRL